MISCSDCHWAVNGMPMPCLTLQISNSFLRKLKNICHRQKCHSQPKMHGLCLDVLGELTALPKIPGRRKNEKEIAVVRNVVHSWYCCTYFDKILHFLSISTHILLVLLFPGSAEADIRWGGNLNGRLMARCVCTKLDEILHAHAPGV